MKEIHYMIDLETLGTSQNSPILSIAAVPFDLSLGCIMEIQPLHLVVNPDSCIQLGGQVDFATIQWWMGQSEEARVTIIQHGANGAPISIGEALNKLGDYLRANDSNPIVWGNGASFDLGILANFYRKLNCKVPWDFWNERDVRTLVSLHKEGRAIVKATVFKGVKHSPVDDCNHQIRYCSKIYNDLMSLANVGQGSSAK